MFLNALGTFCVRTNLALNCGLKPSVGILCTGIFKIRAPLAKTKLLLVKFELGPLHICWKFSDP